MAALYVWRHLYYILAYFVKITNLTPAEWTRIFWVLHPEVRCVLGARAAFARVFLQPAMKKVNKIHNGE